MIPDKVIFEKKAVNAALLSVFREDRTNFLVKPKRRRPDLMMEYSVL